MHNTKTPLQLDADHPWPGLLAYTESEADYFHGREAECRQLLQRVKRQSVTILFGQSGLGKTSLLQAGLFPPLRQQGYLPIYCRLDFHPHSPPLTQQLLQQIERQAHQAGIDTPPLSDSTPLWQALYHRDHEFWDERNRLLTPVIVLDQFEECFTLGQQNTEQRQRTDQFLQQLASLIENRLPNEVEQQLSENPESAETFDFQRGAIPIIITLREDFLADFEGLRQTMPTLAHNRMRLERMQGDAAQQVLLKPAKALLSETTAQELLRFVAGDRQQQRLISELEIEPALLSVIASELNQRRIEQQQPQITPQLLQQSQSEILGEFYARTLADLPDATTRLIEEHLLTEGGYRNSFALDDALLLPGVEHHHIETLIRRRLLRLEERYGSLRIELTHDVLTGVVKHYRDRRRIAEERVRQRRRNRIFASVTVGLLLVIGIFASIAWYAIAQQRQAEQQRAFAEQQRLLAEEQKQLADKRQQEAEQQLLHANHNFGLALHERARQVAQEGDFVAAQFYLANSHPKLIHRDALARSRSLWREVSQANPYQAVWRSPFLTSHHDNRILTLSYLAVSFAPDGRTLASASYDHTIRLWEVASGETLATLSGHTDAVWSVRFAPDGRTLASGSHDNTIRLWDVASGKTLATLTGHTDAVLSVSFAPDGRTLASGSHDNTIRLWSVASGETLITLTGHTHGVNSVSFAPDGRTLASGSHDNTIRLWDVANGETLATLIGHTRTVWSVRFAPDGRTLASSSQDNTIRLWDVASGQMLTTLTGHTHWVYSVNFAPDGSTLVSGSFDGTIRLWEVASGKMLATLRHTDWVNSVSFAPDGRTLASASWDNTIRLWEVASGKTLATLRHTDWVNSVSFAPDGRTLASASFDDTIRLWDVASGKMLATLTGHTRRVTSVSFAPDGRTLASGSHDNTIRLWSVASGEMLATLTGHTSSITSVSFAPDGRTLASSSGDNTIRLWSVASGEMLATLSGHTDPVTSVSFAPDGRTLASASFDGTIRLWEVASGEMLATLTGHTNDVNSVSFAPDGRTLASSSDDNTIRLWSVASGEVLATLTGHTSSVTSVSFASDGRTLASSSQDGTIRLWEVASGEMLATLTGHTGRVTSVRFAPDGRTLASSSYDHTIRLWDLQALSILENPQQRQQWVEKQQQLVGYQLDGLDLVIVPPEPNLYGQPSFEPQWTPNHPFHWLSRAEQGDAEAMLQLGIIYHRSREYDTARDWYQKAEAAGHPDAAERLNVLQRTREISQSLMERTDSQESTP